MAVNPTETTSSNSTLAPLKNALLKASQKTGVSFDYLLNTAQRESSLNANAKAQTSSATGLFQFIESTWLHTLKTEGPKLGLEKYADHISLNKDGHYDVADKDQRKAILDLRKNPEISALLASAFTQNNANYLEQTLKRQPTAGELYIAHFLGPRDAARLIDLAATSPDKKADALFERAAKANTAIFYNNGKAQSIAAVYEKLVALHDSIAPGLEASNKPVQLAQAGQQSQQNNALNSQLNSQLNSWQTQTRRTGQLIDPSLFNPNFSVSRNTTSGEGGIGVWSSIIDVEQQLQALEDQYLRQQMLEAYKTQAPGSNTTTTPNSQKK